MFHKSNLLLSTLFICHEEKMEISRDHSSEQHNTYIRPIARYVNACKYHGLSKEHSFVMTYFTSTMDISDYLHKVTESEACYEWPSRIAIILESIMENVWFIFISYLQWKQRLKSSHCCSFCPQDNRHFLWTENWDMPHLSCSQWRKSRGLMSFSIETRRTIQNYGRFHLIFLMKSLDLSKERQGSTDLQSVGIELNETPSLTPW